MGIDFTTRPKQVIEEAIIKGTAEGEISFDYSDCNWELDGNSNDFTDLFDPFEDKKVKITIELIED